MYKDELRKFGKPTYPGRIYGQYDWDFTMDKWVVSRVWITQQRKFKISKILSKI